LFGSSHTHTPPAKTTPEVPEHPYKIVNPRVSEHSFEAWAAYLPKGAIKPFKYDPRALGPDDVEIKITHCGICASDLHQIDNGWKAGNSTYPIVPGHEIVGHVVAKGKSVTSLEINDRVGVGAQCLSCLDKYSCQYCSKSLEQYCPTATFTYNSKYPDGSIAYGGYAKRVRVHSAFAFKIPDNLSSAEVAPLFCAGATVYEPLKRFEMGKGHKVGVIGIGGLGHLGIQFAAALGCEVTAISHSPAKKDLAMKLGAKHFICTPEERTAAKASFDFLLQTDNYTTDLTSYLAMLKKLGTMCMVGIAEESLHFVAERIVEGATLSGSQIASPSRIREMLQLASDKRIVSMVEEFDISRVNEALAGVRQGKPRFRYVLKIQDKDA